MPKVWNLAQMFTKMLHKMSHQDNQIIPKFSHIIYQSIANFIYFQKNIRTPLGQNRPRGTLYKVNDEVFQIWMCYILIDCKFYILSEKYKSHMLNTNKKPLSGQNSFNWYLRIFYFFVFAASWTVLFTSTLNKFLTWFGCFCNGDRYRWSTTLPKLASTC